MMNAELRMKNDLNNFNRYWQGIIYLILCQCRRYRTIGRKTISPTTGISRRDYLLVAKPNKLVKQYLMRNCRGNLLQLPEHNARLQNDILSRVTARDYPYNDTRNDGRNKSKGKIKIKK